MLLRLLALLRNNDGVTSTREMARRLGASEGLLVQMLLDAVRMGYLSTEEGRCADSTCSGCHQRTTCAAGERPRLWSLTEKGRRLLTRP